MELKAALHNISKPKFYKIIGMSYLTLEHGCHADKSFEQLPESMQAGLIHLMISLYRVQKMVYHYDIFYVNHCIKSCGVKLRPFYDGCDISKTFYTTLSLRREREERLMVIRCELMRMINRLLVYINSSSK